MKSKLLYGLFVLLLVVTGCSRWHGVRGSGDVAEEYRNIDEFSKIQISGAFKLNVIVGEDTQLKISGDDNLLKYIRTDVRGDRLIIETRKNINQKSKMIIDVSTPSLDALDASGANKISISDIDSKRFDLDISGANNVEMDGDADRFYVSMSGATKLYAGQLYAQDVRVECSGASKAEVYARESLDADASGASKVYFYGDAANVRTDVSGVGKIVRKHR